MRAKRQLISLVFALLLAACTPALDWREYRPPEGGFSVLLPQKPGQSIRELSTPAGNITMRMISVRLGMDVLAAGFADFPAPPGQVLVDAMRDVLVENIGGRIQSERSIDVVGGTGREFSATGTLGRGDSAQTHIMRARLIVRDRRYYQLIWLGTRSGMAEADIDLFLGSFRRD